MTTLNKRYPDLLGDENSELSEVIADLDAMRVAATRVALAESRDAAFRSTLAARAGFESRAPRRVLRPIPFRRTLVSTCVALMTVVAGVLGYSQVRPATSVSAAQILHRSLAATIVARPGQVIHQVTIETSTQNSTTPPESHTITTDEWLRLATSDSADRVDLSISEDGRLVHHQVSGGRHTWTYVAQSNTVYEGPATDVQFVETPDSMVNTKGLMFQPQKPTRLRSVVESALASHAAHLLGRHTEHGRLVYVIAYTSPNIPSGRKVLSAQAGAAPINITVTLSVDASTYSVVRLEERTYASRGNLVSDDDLQVATYKVLDPIHIPPHVFQFVAPTGATHAPMASSSSKTAKP